MYIKPNRLKELVVYDPSTGEFAWRINRRGRFGRKGDRAGRIDSRGYIHLTLDGKFHYAHQLAWLYTTGEWPDSIDHINRNRSDNRIANLRIATASENGQNRTAACRNNKIGLLGVSPWHGKWRSTIWINSKQIYLGCFATPHGASAAYQLAKRKFHPFA